MYTNNGTLVNIDYRLIPTGFTKPTVSTFDTEGKAKYDRKFTIPMASVADPVEADTLDAIITEIETQVDALIAAEFDDTANDIVVYSDMYELKTNKTPGVGSTFYTDAAAAYVPGVLIYVDVTPAN